MNRPRGVGRAGAEAEVLHAIGARALDAEGPVLAQQPAERQEDQVLGNMLARSDARVSLCERQMPTARSSAGSAGR